jgi:hypothetical protein
VAFVSDGQRPVTRLTPRLPTTGSHHEFSSDDGGIEWFSIDEAAKLCRRSPSTIYNLVSKYQVRRRLAWTVRNRLRQRQMLLSPRAVAWLQDITLFRRPPVNPPR